MALAYLDTDNRLNTDPEEVQVAGLFREAPQAGLELLQRLFRESRADPEIEFFTYPEATQPFPGEKATTGPYLVPGDPDTMDPEFERLMIDPGHAMSTAHTHPSHSPGSFSPGDLYSFTALSSPIDDVPRPTDYHYVLQPEIEKYEGLRFRTDSPEARALLFRGGPSETLEDLPSNFRDLAPLRWELEEKLYDVEDLLDADLLDRVGLDPDIATEFEPYYAPDFSVPFNKYQIPLMELGEKDVIDYIVTPDSRLDRFFDAYKTLMREK
tara:strand:- start:4965 stop:5768 length:804 start_codon:yes stop_codon:yes gene_type:complete